MDLETHPELLMCQVLLSVSQNELDEWKAEFFAHRWASVPSRLQFLRVGASAAQSAGDTGADVALVLELRNDDVCVS